MSTGALPEKLLDSVEEPRRAFLRRLILGSAYVVPSVASFSMTGLSAREVTVICNNGSGDFGGSRNQDFAGQNLRGQNLANACSVYQSSIFDGANLNGANLSSDNSSLTFFGFYGCSFVGANLNKANLAGTSFSTCNFSGANLQGANLMGATLSGCTLTGANLTNANLTNVTVDPSVLKNADLEGAIGLTTVTWGTGTICPDGTISDFNGGTCLGHLTPA